MTRSDILIRSGLGEEVLADVRKERKVKRLSAKIKKLFDEQKDFDEIAREILDMFYKEDGKYD